MGNMYSPCLANSDEQAFRNHETRVNRERLIERAHLNQIMDAHNDVSYCATMQEHCRPKDSICGSRLQTYRDPLHAAGGIRGGLLDVNGDGELNCGDCHDAFFLAYPVDSQPVVVPSNPSDLTHMLERNEVILELGDLTDETLIQMVENQVSATSREMSIEPSKELQSDEFEDEIQNLASRSGICPRQLRREAFLIHRYNRFRFLHGQSADTARKPIGDDPLLSRGVTNLGNQLKFAGAGAAMCAVSNSQSKPTLNGHSYEEGSAGFEVELQMRERKLDSML